MSRSYKGEVIADSSGQWYSNALRFNTIAEAQAAVEDLESRWTLVQRTRVTPSDDEPNYTWDYIGNRSVPIKGAT